VLAWFVYYASMYAYFQNRGLYDYSINHRLFHDATHLAFFAVGYLYWQPIVGSDPTRWRLPIPARAGSIFLGMPFEAFLGISVSEMTTPIDPLNTLANTHAAGETFWAAAMLISGLCLASVGVQLFRQLGREAIREDRHVQAQTAEVQARAKQLGVQGLRDGWTVPWWRLAQLEAQQRRSRPHQQPERQPPTSG
jgi:putative copper resistance protein D